MSARVTELYVAVDSNLPEPDIGLSEDIFFKDYLKSFASSLRGSGAHIKVEPTLPLIGYQLIALLRTYGLKVFADLKLSGSFHTLARHGRFLRPFKPDIVTVMCSAGKDGMRALKDALPETCVIGIPVLTTFNDDDSKGIFRRKVKTALLDLTEIALECSLQGVIAAPQEIRLIRKTFGDRAIVICPNIRFQNEEVRNDDQNLERTMTPAEAYTATADGIVVGRPIVDSSNPLDIIRRIQKDLKERRQ